MQLPWILEHFTDQDFYSFTMAQPVFHQFPDLHVRFEFKCRNKGVTFTREMVDEIERQLAHYSELGITEMELNALAKKPFFKPSFIEFLAGFKARLSDVTVRLLEDGSLKISVEGLWYRVIFWEEPILSVVNEVYFRHKYTPEQYEEITQDCRAKLHDKVADLKSGRYALGGFTDFGTRRRFSRAWMEEVLGTFAFADLGQTKFLGTSNVWMSILFGIPMVGTNAHQWYQAGQGLKHVPLAHTNAYMLDAWVKEYRGENGTALTDCLGTDHFLKDFDMYHAKLWDGVRNDSGDPFEWGDKIIDHYKKMKVDPKTKTLLFSNSLDFDLAHRLYEYFKDKAKVGFGIGTFLTGVQKFKSSWGEDVEPLNIVLKMVECNGRPVAKLSDDVGKGMCENDAYIKYLRETVTLWAD